MTRVPVTGFIFSLGIMFGFIVSYFMKAPASNQAYYNFQAQNRTAVHRPPMSHEEVNAIPGPTETIEFKDSAFHHDDDAVAKDLFKKIRVLCWVMTQPDNLKTRAIHVRATWGKRCNILLFVSDVEDRDFPTIPIEPIEHGRDHLTAKTMRAFDYVYKRHFDDADWFVKADDDTYLIVENLRYMLSAHQTNESIFFGHHFKVIVSQGYYSGGGGYVLSKEALKRYGTRKAGQCSNDAGAEDVEFGRCMESLGVQTTDSRDVLGRSRFHCFNPETHIHGGYPDWYYKYDKYGAKKGIESMSDYAITFHYISVEQMYNLEYYIYHLKPFGIVNGLQKLNPALSGGDPAHVDQLVEKIAKTVDEINEKTANIEAGKKEGT